MTRVNTADMITLGLLEKQDVLLFLSYAKWSLCWK